MSFHRSGAYAVNMGLDPDNVLRIGGWSAAANRWQLDMSGNETLAGALKFLSSGSGIRGNTSNYLALYGPTAYGDVGGMFFCADIATDCSTLSSADTRRLMFLGSTGAMIIRAGLTQNGSPDVAENIKVDDQTIIAGDIVRSVSPNTTSADMYAHAKAAKSETSYEGTVIGVISSEPGILLNSGGAVGPEKALLKDQRPLTLVGRVPTKVSTENGPIYAGDPITSSSIPGVGMKATKAGQIVGKALDSYTNSNPQAVGKVMTLVNISWYDPDATRTTTLDLKIAGDNNNYTLTGKDNVLITKIGAFAELVVAHIQAGYIETKKLVVDGVDILKKVEELSTKSDEQQKTIEAQQKQIEEMKKTVEELKK